MSKSSLDTLIELASDARNEAAQLLASERNNSQLAAAQLSALEGYRNEYMMQLQTVMDEGLDLATLQNYQAFLASLEKAISQARDGLKYQEQKVVNCQQNWQQEQRKLSSYDMLRLRRKEQLRQQERRQESRANDEISANFMQRTREQQLQTSTED